ncbi:MAG: hypothetical protein H6Q69_3355 [Firmicutes bacterium]|nr:hypothetical protein [Bacillota bacterium]
MTIELKVLENNHSFKWNYEPAKAFVAESIKQYVGLVVSETNLADMEKTQKEIAGLRIRLQKFRLSVKKDMEKPYEAFELQVKELAGLIDSAEKPIKDQLQKYEDKRMEDKRTECQDLIITVAAELGLEEKYRNQIVIDDKWINRGSKIKSIKEDIQMRAVYFLDQQKADKEAETFRQQKIEMAKFMIESLSKDLATPLTFADVENKIESLNIGELREYIENQVATRKEREERAAQLALEREEAKRITEVARQEREAAEQAILAEQYKEQQKEKEIASKFVPTFSQAVAAAPNQPKYNAQFVAVAYDITVAQINEIKNLLEGKNLIVKVNTKEV